MAIRKRPDRTLELTANAVGTQADNIIRYELKVRADPTDVDALTNLAVSLHDSGRLDEALEVYRSALALSPEIPSVLYNIGLLQVDLGNFVDSRAWFRKAVHADDRDPDIWYGYARSLEEHDDGEAINAYQTAIAIQPDHFPAIFNLAVLFKRIGRVDEAIEQYEKALALEPACADAHYSLGNATRAKGDFRQAVHCYRTAIRHDRKRVSAWNNLALTLLDLQRYYHAAAAARNGLKLAPDDPTLHTLLGEASVGLGDTALASQEYHEARNCDPTDLYAAIHLADFLLQQRRFEEVVALTRTLVAEFPGEPDMILMMCEALDELGEYTEAEKHYIDGLAKFPDTPDTPAMHHNYGLCLIGQERTSDAIVEYRKAIELAPVKWLYRAALGKAQRETGAIEEALVTFKEALELAKDEPDLLYEIGTVYEDLGDVDLAIANWRRALRMKPDAEIIQLANEALSSYE
jgi:tetratricopeptide (TPR) repeat protein